MSNKYRTAHGKQLDIDKLRLVNEKTIAVGNMKVNARGDQLGQGGQIVTPRNQVMNQQYKIQGTIISDNDAPIPMQMPDNVAPDGESFDPPEYQEPVKQPEPKLRGSLADSIAKETPPTTKGPQRI
jgi:hypothetical protein